MEVFPPGFAGDLIDFVNVDDAVLGSPALRRHPQLEKTLEHGFHRRLHSRPRSGVVASVMTNGTFITRANACAR